MSQTKSAQLSRYLKPSLTSIFLLIAILALCFLPRLSIKFLTVTSASMAPALSVGSVVISVSSAIYHPGEIIVFRNSAVNELVIHRVIKQQKNRNISYLTQGDANNRLDSQPVLASSVVGKVIFSLPFLGYFISWAQSLPGLVFLVFIPAGYLIYSSVKSAT